MRDIVVLIFVLLCIYYALKKPWYGVLSLAIFSYLNPHAYAWGAVRALPFFQILFFVVAFSTFMTKDKQRIPKDWRITVFIFLWLYFFLTTSQAYLQDLAWPRLWHISKIFLPFYFTLVLINTRQKLFYLICTIAASIGVIAVKGGIFAVLTGFNYRVYGPPATQFAENNAFAVAVLICIPLLILWRNEIRNKTIRSIILFSIPLCIASSLSSWSRGALLTLGVLSLILVRHSKRKILAIPILFIAVTLSPNFLPDEWFDRMHTLEHHEQNASAMNRIEAWTDGWNHTLEHPFVGSGFEGWRIVTQRDWHNSYVEMFSEHGFIAFALWLSLILGSLISLTRLPKLTKNINGMEWVENYCFMIRTSLICYMVGTLFLGLSYWDLLYHLIFISVLTKKFALEELAEKNRYR